MTGLFSDVYYEVERDAEFVLRERGSKFYAYVYGVRSEAEVKEKLEVLKREYPDATHHCYAWVMGARCEAQRANDDGEPGNSAPGRVEKYIEEVFEVSAAFEHEQEIHRLVAKFGARVLGSEYTDAVCYRLAVKVSGGRAFEQAVNDHYQLTGKLIVG